MLHVHVVSNFFQILMWLQESSKYSDYSVNTRFCNFFAFFLMYIVTPSSNICTVI